MDRRKALCRVLACVAAAFAAPLTAQTLVANRLDTHEFDVLAPSQRVLGAPGTMHIAERSCPALASGNLRRRIVDLADLQLFGFGPVLDDDRAHDASADSGERTQSTPTDRARNDAAADRVQCLDGREAAQE